MQRKHLSLPRKSSYSLRSDYTQFMLKGLQELNNNKALCYPRDAFTVYNRALKTATGRILSHEEYLSTLTALGFSCSTVNYYIDLRISGKNPAHALTSIQKQELFILDCNTSLQVLQQMFLLKKIGSILYNFRHSKGLRLDRQLNIFYRRFFQQQYSELRTYDDLSVLESGDHIYIMGHPLGYAYKPSGASNAFNALVERTEESIILRAFHSNTHKAWTFESLMAHLKTKFFDEELTYADAQMIVHNRFFSPDQKVQHCPLTYREVYESFSRIDQNKLLLSSSLVQTNKRDPKDYCGVFVPDSAKDTPLVGLACMFRLNEQAFTNYIRTGKTADKAPTTVVPIHSPVTLEPSMFDALKQDQDWPRTLFESVSHFVKQCMNQDDRTALGTIIHGSPGSGKSTLARRAVQELRRQGKRVLELNPGDIAVPKSVDGTEDILEHLAALDGSPLEHDIFYIDGVDNLHCDHLTICKAIIQHTRVHNKRVLVTSNLDPYGSILDLTPRFLCFVRTVKV